MEKKAFVVEACKPRAIDIYFPKLVVLAESREKALEALKERGLEYHIDARGGGDYMIYYWYGISSRCELIELPLLDAEKVLA